jgi:hypothetical protein
MKKSKILALFSILLIVVMLTGGCTPQPRAIMGRISYAGTQIGSVKVVAIRPGEQGVKSRYEVGMNDLGSYNMRVRTGTYTISAYMDTDYDNKQAPNEPFGYYDGNGDDKTDEIIVKGEVTGIDIMLHDPVTDYLSFIDNLLWNGASVKIIGNEAFQGIQSIFSGTGKRIELNNENISILDYEDETIAAKEAKFISTDGFRFESENGREIVNISWIAPPHFYQSGSIIVLYVGKEQETLDLLRILLGPPFAGAK